VVLALGTDIGDTHVPPHDQGGRHILQLLTDFLAQCDTHLTTAGTGTLCLRQLIADVLTRQVLGQSLPAMGRAPFAARVCCRSLGHRRRHLEVLVLGKEGLLAWV
jgi:hypothetical protein